MTPAQWNILSLLADAAPFLLLLLVSIFHFGRKHLGRTATRRGGKNRLGFTASTFTIGLALQNLETLMRPNVEHVIEQKYDEDAEDDTSGDPDLPKAQLHRQLRRIRRGEKVDRIILRLK
jgi:hypothetical protein